MKNLNVKIQYLYNSGFTVETPSAFMVFDYFKGDVVLSHKPMYVFSSHSHPDHFSPKIFKWEEEKKDIKYILSNDIKQKLIEKKVNIAFVSPYEELEVNRLKIKAFGSTDIGVSFLVEVDGISIFHAGDLNWWHWWDDTEEESEKGESRFNYEISKIKGNNIDIAFFPVDPRLKQNYALGGEYFIKELSPVFFIPMHFGDKFEINAEFAQIVSEYSTKVLKLSHRGQEIKI